MYRTILDYNFNSTLGTCYKFHLNSARWIDASSLCHIEESYLAIIDTQAEADFFVEMARITEKEEIISGSIHLGFRKERGFWNTVKSKVQKLLYFFIIDGELSEQYLKAI